ncbi:MAG: NAAT family transporter [Candidatus Neomarinimicrobiota bacterium]|jgi:multiple antibiotic resistance protein|nr:NAAT family transporter [Candidatus Neomarinimicrobiota bacterium]MED5248191.1 NAAT family transporter [Candidatus Neomarinimicrobiota bacterium]|tara:strand:+ start:352 stop:996 length:645 start_codon:yes stop_codon:yes gene_type:complete
MIDSLNIELQYLLFCLSTLFTVVNPLGITPIFAAMTERFSNADQIRIARKGIITGSTVLVIFTLLGSFIFRFYGITVEAFQIMGGIIFFRSGLRMLDAQVGRSRTTQSERDEFKDSDELAISPIGVPLITGPGAITGVVILSGKGSSDFSIITLLFAVIITMTLFYWILRAGNVLAKRIGITGMRVIERMMGLILMVIAVQFIINGLETIIDRI